MLACRILRCITKSLKSQSRKALKLSNCHTHVLEQISYLTSMGGGHYSLINLWLRVVQLFVLVWGCCISGHHELPIHCVIIHVCFYCGYIYTSYALQLFCWLMTPSPISYDHPRPSGNWKFVCSNFGHKVIANKFVCLIDVSPWNYM